MSRRAPLAWLCAALLALTNGCASCPRPWFDELPEEPDFVYAAASVGELGLALSGESVALSRAARALAEQLGLEVTSSSVTRLGQGLVVEVAGPSGVHAELEPLELVDQARCAGRVHVLVRLPRVPR